MINISARCVPSSQHGKIPSWPVPKPLAAPSGHPEPCLEKTPPARLSWITLHVLYSHNCYKRLLPLTPVLCPINDQCPRSSCSFSSSPPVLGVPPQHWLKSQSLLFFCSLASNLHISKMPSSQLIMEALERRRKLVQALPGPLEKCLPPPS